MSVRKKFIGAASSCSSLLPLNVLTAITGQRFILPFYHVVSNEDCKHIKHLYQYKNSTQFERDLDYLALNYHPVGPEELESVLAGKYKGKKVMLLSFDDGLREMYDVVAPILLRKGIPAVFFVNTDFIDNRDLMFRYKASLIIEEYGLNTSEAASLLAITNASELTETLNGKYAFDFNVFLQTAKPYMTGEQIKWMMEKGFTIGAHSVNHPYFADITFEEQVRQVEDSVSILHTDYGIKQKLFAFPFTDEGVTEKFFEFIFSNNTVDFSFGSAGIKNDIHVRQLQRIPMEGWKASAEEILKAEYLYYLMLMPLFKNKVARK